MDNQPASPNSPRPSEGQPNHNPETIPAPTTPPEAVSTGQPAGPGAAAAPVKLTPDQVNAAIAATPAVGAPPAAVPTANPALAADVDVIEPEWVEKAEAVVRAHHGDPYAEEEAIEALQEDYLQKRYGINVAEPDADDSKPKGT